MTHYLALVHKDPESAWGVTFPDLPGCFSAADEERQLIPNAMEALELWFDGAQAEPLPSSIETLRARADIAAELAAGAYLVAVPYRYNARKVQRVNITLDRGLLDRIDDEAERRKMTRSSFLAQAAEREMEG